MTVDFQKNLLKYLIQVRDVRECIPFLESNLFDLDIDKVIFSFVQTYINEFKYQPSKINLIEFFDRKEKAELFLTEGVKKEILEGIDFYYQEIGEDTEIYKSTIFDFTQRKRVQRFIEKNADALNDTTKEISISKWVKEFSDIRKITDENIIEKVGGAYLFKDYKKIVINKNHATPTFLKGLNLMTADGGFFSPQIIVIMSGPKGFKTGTCINLAKHFVFAGKKVFYVDFENSYGSILNRIYQSMLECTKGDLLLPENIFALKKMITYYSKRGGDLRAEFFPAFKTTIDDIDNRLQELKEDSGWVPDIIIYDYIDLAGCSDRSLKEKRFQIQHNYHHVKQLNYKYNTFAITMSQISRDAWKSMNKYRYINVTSFSEDWGKAQNTDAAFAMCRSEEDIENKMGFIIPIVQREGIQFMEGLHCPVKIDLHKQLIIENEDYARILRAKIKEYHEK